jgi:hypothetical protein
MSRLVRHVMTESPRTLGPAEDAAGLMAKYDVAVDPGPAMGSPRRS